VQLIFGGAVEVFRSVGRSPLHEHMMEITKNIHHPQKQTT